MTTTNEWRVEWLRFWDRLGIIIAWQQWPQKALSVLGDEYSILARSKNNP